MVKFADLARRDDFPLGDLRLSPARRRVDGPKGSRHIEPQVMLVFLRLLESAGKVVTRSELFDDCWGSAVVGDDSLNRAVAGARQIATCVGSSAFTIETVPRTGYRLRLRGEDDTASTGADPACAEIVLQTAVEDAFDCWRTGLPTPDTEAVHALSKALVGSGGYGRAWGVHALLLRKASEYAEPAECAEFVRQCEQSARRALALVPNQSDALVALASIIPLFGNWGAARERLAAVRSLDPDHVPAAHDLAVLEMATGRASVAGQIVAELIERDPLAATFYYKRMYHLWTLGEIAELELVASRALQLWPRHPAIWSARLWTLVFTGRAAQALIFLNDGSCRPKMQPAAIDLLRHTCMSVASTQSGGDMNTELRGRTIDLALSGAARGPAQAVAALIALCAVNAVSEAYDVAYGYYLGHGRAVTPVRRRPGDPSITDQHRRVTQPLFIPSAQCMRDDPRFARLCGDLGLTGYWKRYDLTPDFWQT